MSVRTVPAHRSTADGRRGLAAALSPYRPFRVRVARRAGLGPSLVRLTFTGEDLHRMASAGHDQRVKLVLPLPGLALDGFPDGADWYAQWRALPDGRRHPIRTYTVRSCRPLLRELDIDLVLHGATGPASAWAQRAAPGDELLVLGPDEAYDGDRGGVEWRPPAPSCALLLAGDETALPAICAIVEQLPADAHGHAVLEVPEDGDVLDLSAPAGLTVTWLPRRGERHGRLLAEAVLAVAPGLLDPSARSSAVEGLEDAPGDDLPWHVPAGAAASAPCYAWLAGEAGVVTHLRRCLVRDLGVDRRCVAFMGYWRQGQPARS